MAKDKTPPHDKAEAKSTGSTGDSNKLSGYKEDDSEHETAAKGTPPVRHFLSFEDFKPPKNSPTVYTTQLNMSTSLNLDNLPGATHSDTHPDTTKMGFDPES